MAEKDKDGYLEKMFQEFVKDMVRKGIFSPFEPGEATGKKCMTMDDLFEKFKEQKDKFMEMWEEKEGAQDVESTPASDPADEPMEVVYLRAKLDQLKRQLEDKDEIIQLQKQELKRLRKVAGED